MRRETLGRRYRVRIVRGLETGQRPWVARRPYDGSNPFEFEGPVKRFVLVPSVTEGTGSHRAVVEADLPTYRTAGTLRHALNASRKPSGKGDATKRP